VKGWLPLIEKFMENKQISAEMQREIPILGDPNCPKLYHFNKDQLIDLISFAFFNETRFDLWLECLETKFKEVITTVVNYPFLVHEHLVEKTGVQVLQDKYSFSHHRDKIIKPGFEFLLHEVSDYFSEVNVLFIVPPVSEVIKSLLNSKKEPPIRSSEQPPEGATVFNQTDAQFFDNLQLGNLFRQGEGLDYFYGDEVPKKVVNGLYKRLGTPLYVPKGPFRDMEKFTALMIAQLWMTAGRDKTFKTDPKEVKWRIHSFIETYGELFCASVVFHIKGKRKNSLYSYNKMGRRILLAIDLIKDGKWYETENFLEMLQFNSLFFLPLKLHAFKDFGTGPPPYDDYKDSNIYIYQHDRYVHRSFVKGLIYALASLGCVDIVVDPVDEKFPESPFEGLKGFCLNDFGKYVFEYTDSYDREKSKLSNEIHLSEDALIVTDNTPGQNVGKILSDYSRQIAANKFLLDEAKIRNTVQQGISYNKRLSFIRDILPSDLPPVWKAFFEKSGKEAGNFLIQEMGLRIFNLSNLDPVLFKNLISDPNFPELVIRAEGHRILVEEKNMRSFDKLCKRYGILQKAGFVKM
jgi:hypothetical protein